ncbi:MAG: O-antigen ligase family protein, partial [Bacilli bacterium]|nr:O-antigen ligase family protein [Bacilli bacterium]
VIGALILVITMLIELIYGHYYLEVFRLRPAGLLLDPNVAAFALNIALIISFYRAKKQNLLRDIFFIISRILIIFGVFLTVSRSGYLSTIMILFSFLIYYSKGKNRLIVPITATVIIVLYFLLNPLLSKSWENLYQMLDLQRIFPKVDIPNVPGPSGPVGGVEDNPIFSDARVGLLKAGLKVFLANYTIGVGIGNITGAVNAQLGMPMNTHNLVIQLLAESGIIMLGALLIFLYYLIHLIGKSQKKQRFFLTLILLVIIVESFFNHNLLNINIVYLLLAFFLALNIIFSKEQLILSLSKLRNRFRN